MPAHDDIGWDSPEDEALYNAQVASGKIPSLPDRSPNKLKVGRPITPMRSRAMLDALGTRQLGGVANTLQVKVEPETYKTIDEIARIEDRTKTQTVRALIRLGILAWHSLREA